MAFGLCRTKADTLASGSIREVRTSTDIFFTSCLEVGLPYISQRVKYLAFGLCRTKADTLA
ncbi:MAG: hypothetical protein U9Q34_04440, partial [Elusimicrobiota bacterium]|nr:hypothetical protein [Elusimicrobiota bacterium]